MAYDHSLKVSVKFQFVGRDGPAANSSPTLAINARILIVLESYCGKFRFIELLLAPP